MTIMGAAWLAAGNLPAYPGPHAPLLGFCIDRSIYPTRWEEYGFVLESLATTEWQGPILDAATGFDPAIHTLSCLMGAMNYETIALDREPATLDLPAFASVTRLVGDITALPQSTDSMGVVCNISVLEHLDGPAQKQAWAEAYRVLRPGGTFLVTADTWDPTHLTNAATATGFEIGPVVHIDGPALEPPVSWIRCRKPLPVETA